jgi:hypothetical protein
VNTILPALKFPAPTANKFIPLPDLGIVIEPETESVNPRFNVKEVAVAVVKVIDAHAASAVIVTLCPPSMVTTSPATGTDTPDVPPEVADQVEVAFQLPVATEKRIAP